ncbi:hypothetical protein [Fodinibius sediminis]|nr:hypothetical protein [Fodinibius sediminis]
MGKDFLVLLVLQAERILLPAPPANECLQAAVSMAGTKDESRQVKYRIL